MEIRPKLHTGGWGGFWQFNFFPIYLNSLSFSLSLILPSSLSLSSCLSMFPSLFLSLSLSVSSVSPSHPALSQFDLSHCLLVYPVVFSLNSLSYLFKHLSFSLTSSLSFPCLSRPHFFIIRFQTDHQKHLLNLNHHYSLDISQPTNSTGYPNHNFTIHTFQNKKIPSAAKQN